MGDKRPPRSTQKLDANELARMARASIGEVNEDLAPPGDNDWQDVELAVDSQANAESLHARTATVDDPMTMALLAEVARNSRTVEFDPTTLQEAKAASEKADAASEKADADTPHPHIKRRRS